MLEVENVSLSFNSRKILDGVSLKIGFGELVGLIGPNGAGKSTLMRIMAGVRKSQTGAALYEGKNLYEISPADLAQKLSYLAQGAAPDTPMRAELIVALGRLPHNDKNKAAIDAAMQATDVYNLKHRAFNTLSGGEKLRVLLARTLAVEAPFLLADEPIAALDPYHQLMVLELFKNMARSGKTIIVILHDLNLAARFCDRLILLDKGKTVADGQPETVLTEENLKGVYNVVAQRYDRYIGFGL